jgi:hypothetical protein
MTFQTSKKFYSDLFGWKIEKWPGAVSRDMEYWMMTTTDERRIRIRWWNYEKTKSTTSSYQFHRCKISRRIFF